MRSSWKHPGNSTETSKERHIWGYPEFKEVYQNASCVAGYTWVIAEYI